MMRIIYPNKRVITVNQGETFLGYIKSVSYKNKTYTTVPITEKKFAKKYSSHKAIMKDLQFLWKYCSELKSKQFIVDEFITEPLNTNT